MARKGLGKGLDAILGDAAPLPEVTRSGSTDGVQMIPIGDIKPDPDQPRKTFEEGLLEELAASIKSQGVLQPILVRPGKGDTFIIIAGERRWRAAGRAGLHEIPALIRQADTLAVAEMALIENLQRADLNPMEEAEAYTHLRDTLGRKPGDIADAVGKSRSHIANMIRLNGLPESVKHFVISGDLSMGHARALLSAKMPEAIAAKVVMDNLSVRETEKLIQKEGKPQGRGKSGTPAKTDTAPSGSKDADTKSLERDLEAALGLSVAIEHGKKGGNVTLTYDTLDQLDDICRRLMGTPI